MNSSTAAAERLVTSVSSHPGCLTWPKMQEAAAKGKAAQVRACAAPAPQPSPATALLLHARHRCSLLLAAAPPLPRHMHAATSMPEAPPPPAAAAAAAASSSAAAAAASSRPLRIFCWNINSLAPTVRNIDLRHGSLEAFFRSLDADIVCMQEVKLPSAKLTKELVVVPGYQSYWACSEGKTGYSGVTTWAREELAAVSAEADGLLVDGLDKEGRVLETDHGPFVLLNVYVPNAGDRPARPRLDVKLGFLAALQGRVRQLLDAGRQVVAVGDFNVAAEQRDVHSAINWEGQYTPAELGALHGLLGCCTDTWRHLHPQQEGVYTVWSERTSARAFNVGLRIDFALVSPGLLPHVAACEVLLNLPPKWSDHAPLMLELQLPAAAGDAAAAQEWRQQQQQRRVACAMWQQLLKRFQDPAQRSIASMFKAAADKKPAVAAAAAASPSGRTAAGEQDSGGAEADAARKRRRADDDDDAAGAAATEADAQPNSSGDTAAGSGRAGKAAKLAAEPPQQQDQRPTDKQQQQQQQPSSQHQPSPGKAARGGQPPGGGKQASKGSRGGKQTGGSSKQPDPKQPKLSSFFKPT